MARIVVAGGGICGMAAALVLAEDGHEIVLLDRDSGPVPADVEAAWRWERLRLHVHGSLLPLAGTDTVVRPWHEATAALDRARMTEVRAAIDGVTVDPSPEAAVAAAMVRAASTDEHVGRWFAEMLTCLALPAEVLSRPGVFDRVIELAGDAPPPDPYGPDRTRLLELIE